MTNRIFLDTEFYEDGRTIQLISIGLVKESGETYYAVTPDGWRLAQSTRWLYENVLGGLTGPVWNEELVKGHRQIANEIVEFAGEAPEFWAWYGSYDWVVLCQLYGRMIDLPPGWPMYIRDFKQLVDEAEIELKQPESDDQHNALHDAEWLRGEFLLKSPGFYRRIKM